MGREPPLAGAVPRGPRRRPAANPPDRTLGNSARQAPHQGAKKSTITSLSVAWGWGGEGGGAGRGGGGWGRAGRGRQAAARLRRARAGPCLCSKPPTAAARPARQSQHDPTPTPQPHPPPPPPPLTSTSTSSCTELTSVLLGPHGREYHVPPPSASSAARARTSLRRGRGRGRAGARRRARAGGAAPDGAAQRGARPGGAPGRRANWLARAAGGRYPIPAPRGQRRRWPRRGRGRLPGHVSRRAARAPHLFTPAAAEGAGSELLRRLRRCWRCCCARAAAGAGPRGRCDAWAARRPSCMADAPRIMAGVDALRRRLVGRGRGRGASELRGREVFRARYGRAGTACTVRE
jgi:hypothetical protein